jgi:transcriptional regulator with XRE-family HTH domain
LFIHFKMAKKKILIAFGDKVRELRKEKGLSQEELSFKADLHRTYIGMIERAEKNITLTNIEKIAKALDVHPSKLLITK